MGEIADAIIDGEFDYMTGEYMGRGGGFPRTSQRERKNKKIIGFSKLQPETKRTLHYLVNHKNHKQKDAEGLIISYIESLSLKDYDALNIENNCKMIQKEWNRFMQWYFKNQTS